MSENLLLLTVITPACNQADIIERTIQSVLQQDYQNIEYIVLDDGSQDTTCEILERYAGKLSWESHPTMGLVVTINKGISMAQGEIICVLNPGELLLPGSVSTVVNFFKAHPRALVAYPDWLEVDDGLTPVQEHRLRDDTLWQMLSEVNVAFGPGVFVRSKAFEMVGQRDLAFQVSGEMDFLYRIAAYDGLKHITQFLAARSAPVSTLTDGDSGALAVDERMQIMRKFFSNRALPERIRRLRNFSLGLTHNWAASAYPTAPFQAFKHSLAAFFFDPLNSLYRAAGKTDGSRRSKLYREIWSFLARMGVEPPAERQKKIFEATLASTHPPVKFAFVSHVLPPSWSGQAVVIERLLNQLNPDDYCLISVHDYAHNNPEETNRRLPGAYFTLPAEQKLSEAPHHPAVYWINALYRIAKRGMAIIRIARSQHCRVILAGTGEPFDLPAAFLASWLLNIPFIPYLFDDYTYQWTEPILRSIAAKSEEIMFPRSAKIFVPNEFTRDEIFRRHGIVPVIIRNPGEGNNTFIRPGRQEVRGMLDEVKLVYTGAVYHVNFAAFRNIIAAINLIDRSAYNIKLHLFTALPISWLELNGVGGESVVFHQHVPPAEVAEAQANANILLIPFSFNSSHSTVPEIIKTSAPGKLGDYLSSGSPILAHVPPDSFVSWYLKKYACGVVVDEEDPEQLARSIVELLKNTELVEHIVQQALERARLDFKPDVSRETFLRVLEIF